MKILSFILAAVGIVTPAAAQKLDASIVIGRSARIWSDALGEERRILLYTPAHYERSRRRYPVVYLLDAEMHFHHATGVVQFLSSPDNGRIPEMIVVGITNTNRPRDLTPPTNDAAERRRLPGAGQADAFLRFLTEELIPWVEARHRTEPFRILVGHSLGGLFTMHALLSRPQSFQACIVASAALRWNQRATLERAKRELGRIPPPHFLFMSWGDNEPLMRDPTRELVGWLEKHPPPGINWSHRYYAGDDHSSTPHPTLYDGLEAIFAGWRLPFEADDVPIEHELSGVEAHYAAISKKYGFKVPVSRAALDSVARSLLRRKHVDGALALLLRNVHEYPEDFRVYRSLADALEQIGCPQEALATHLQALKVATEDEYQNGSMAVEYERKAAELRAGSGVGNLSCPRIE